MPQPRRELVPEARVDVPKVRPQGVMCTASLAQAVLAVCLPVRVSTTRRAERKSRAFVSGRKIALAAGFAIAASL